jgi:Photosynthesis affected mutant 68
LQGITYSIMSASWDPDREGSFLGTDEFSQNLGNIKSGLSRSRDNAILREQMATPSFPQDELDALDRKTATKKASSFQEKMGEEMDN